MNNFIKYYLTLLKTNKQIKNLCSLFIINVLGVPIGIITSILLTKFLGSQRFGDYKFLLSIFNTAVILFSFGFYQAGNRAMVLNHNNKRSKEYYGAELIMTCALFIIMALFLILYTYFDNNIKEKDLNFIFVSLIPFSWIFLLARYYETLLIADNKIDLLKYFRILPNLGFLLTLIIIILLNKDINIFYAIIALFILNQVLFSFWILSKLNICFSNIRSRLKEIWLFNKSFGFNVYLGSVFAVGFASISEVLISYFSLDNKGVGFYSLALSFSMPLLLIPNTVATIKYKDFSINKILSNKLIFLTLGLSLIGLVVLWILIGPFVHFFYGHEFKKVIYLTYIISIGITAHGFADFFNRFLGANGQGKMLRNSALMVGFFLLFFNLLFISLWKEKGAAYARSISGFIYLLNMVYYFYTYKNRNK